MDKTKNFKIARLEENRRYVILVDGKQITEEYVNIEAPDKDGFFLVRKVSKTRELYGGNVALLNLDGKQVSIDYKCIGDICDDGFRSAWVIGGGMVLLKSIDGRVVQISDVYKSIDSPRDDYQDILPNECGFLRMAIKHNGNCVLLKIIDNKAVEIFECKYLCKYVSYADDDYRVVQYLDGSYALLKDGMVIAKSQEVK